MRFSHDAKGSLEVALAQVPVRIVLLFLPTNPQQPVIFVLLQVVPLNMSSSSLSVEDALFRVPASPFAPAMSRADHCSSGKTSGRMKTEKRLKKIAEEQKQQSMSMGDTPTGMSDAFSRRQVKTGEAHMVLSVGNKGSVQMGDAKIKGKGKR